VAALNPIKKAAVYAMSLADNADDVVRVVDDVTKVGDDWGWKGGKPGEITGGELRELALSTRSPVILSTTINPYNVRSVQEQALRMADQLERTENPAVREAYNNVLRRLSNVGPAGYLPKPTASARANAAGDMALRFSELEKAGVPREWTGKVFTAMQQLPSHMIWPYADKIRAASSPRGAIAQVLSDFMRPMTNDQRETFLAMLPEWEGSLDDLADAARSL